jgi:hypothetical protein
MTLLAGLLQSYVAAFLVGMGVGAVTMGVVRLIKGALNAGD